MPAHCPLQERGPALSVDLFLQRHPDQTQYSLAGCDISGFQGPDAIDPAFDFVIIKATEGQTYDEEAAPAQRDRAIAQGKPYGYYHFARPDLHNPEEEAYHFSTVVQCLGGPGDVPPAIDCENPGPPAQPMPGDWTAWVLRWLQLVEAELGVRPVVYTAPSFAGEHFTSDPALGSYSLWLAHYAGAGQPPWVPWPWTEAHIWQWTSTSATYGHLDLNVAVPALLAPTIQTPNPQGAATPMAIGGLTDQQAADLEQIRQAAVKTFQAFGSPEGNNVILEAIDGLITRRTNDLSATLHQHLLDTVVAPALSKIPTASLWAELGRRSGFTVDVTPIAPPPPPAPPPAPADATPAAA